MPAVLTPTATQSEAIRAQVDLPRTTAIRFAPAQPLPAGMTGPSALHPRGLIERFQVPPI